MIQLLVFLPLVTALVAGLGGRALGHTPAKIITTAGLFVSAALAWVIFAQFWLEGAAAVSYFAGLREVLGPQVADELRSSSRSRRPEKVAGTRFLCHPFQGPTHRRLRHRD